MRRPEETLQDGGAAPAGFVPGRSAVGDRPAPQRPAALTNRREIQERSLCTPAWPRYPLRRVDRALAVALFAAALAVRAPLIWKGETLLHSDEAIVGIMAQDIGRGAALPIYFYGQRYMGALEAYVIAAVSLLVDNPVRALRIGPAIFFGLLVAAQYLMLTRWLGRTGGLVGATALMLASPMFAQWSISARGAYIEIMLVGSLLLWAWGEWFVAPPAGAPTAKQRLMFGLLTGFGLWLNPSVALFIAPILIHLLLDRPLARLFGADHAIARGLRAFGQRFGAASLPVLAVAAALSVNAVWAVWVADGKIRHMVLLNLLPRPAAACALAAAGLVTAGALARRRSVVTSLRTLLTRNAPLIVGIIVGALPAAVYVFQTAAGVRPMEPALPLGLRPLWLAGETLHYLLRGLPLLAGADPRPFLELVSVGRDTAVLPVTATVGALLSFANWLVLGVLATCVVVIVRRWRGELLALLCLRPACHPPAVLLAIGLGTIFTLFVLGGCTLDFTTIRYMLPIWVFLPGLLASIVARSDVSVAVRVTPLVALAAWGLGQFAMYRSLGQPHPLRPLADRLVAAGIDPAIAEPLDAHLLTYLTAQRCRTAEFESFWPRLRHLRPLVERGRPVDYIVQTTEIDRSLDWVRGGYPGYPPPETARFLWPRLRRAIRHDPSLVVGREPLGGGYERITLRKALKERRPP